MSKRFFITAMIMFALISFSQDVFAKKRFDIRGGSIWEHRTGPGIAATLGGTTCTGNYCYHNWDPNLFGSITGTFGFFYRAIPNLEFFAEGHVGYLNTHWHHNDHGLTVGGTGGAEFHLPIFNWLDPWVGMGFGYSYLRFVGNDDPDWDRPQDRYVLDLHGINFEPRTGVDIYPSRRVPTLAFGPVFRYSIVGWLGGCGRYENERICHDYGEVIPHSDDRPFLWHAGVRVRYGF